MSTGSRVIAPSWPRGRKVEEGLLEVTTDKTQVSIVGPLSAEQVATPGSLGASPNAPLPQQREWSRLDVDLVEVRGGDEGFDGRLIHVPRFAEARSIASNSVSLKRQPSASRLALA